MGVVDVEVDKKKQRTGQEATTVILIETVRLRKGGDSGGAEKWSDLPLTLLWGICC